MVNSAGPNKKINLQANNNIQRPQQNYPQQNYQNNEGNSQLFQNPYGYNNQPIRRNNYTNSNQPGFNQHFDNNFVQNQSMNLIRHDTGNMNNNRSMLNQYSSVTIGKNFRDEYGMDNRNKEPIYNY